ncbi:O-6-methylguanine DNA methyltransferase [Alkalibacillus flavidus]|uniref:Methylated-DNA--protein-cysteine methyltransferase n=1 Tax=Alkalibacillus flavidus TaxID=546021 RepID=A0ABV2KY01_9BACI
MTIYVAEYESPVGPLYMGGTETELYWIKYGTRDHVHARFDQWLNKYFANVTFYHQPDLFSDVFRQFDAYFNQGLEQFDMNLTLHGTDFQRDVWQALLDIPYGDTWSYLDVAEAINRPKAVRAVGGAVNRNPFTIVVPCHRVVGKNGSLVGYGGGLDKKKSLLSLETVLR